MSIRQNISAEQLAYHRMTDDELLDAYAATQRAVYFDQLYGRYFNKIYGKCLTMLKDQALAQDAVQEIFTKIYLNLGSFNRRSKFSTWIYSITYNYCIDLIRKASKIALVFEDGGGRLPDVEDDTESDKRLFEIEVSRLKAVLDRIPADDKAVLLMKYQDDMSIREIGDIFEKTESAVKMKIKRAKMKALQAYKELFPEEEDAL